MAVVGEVVAGHDDPDDDVGAGKKREESLVCAAPLWEVEEVAVTAVEDLERQSVAAEAEVWPADQDRQIHLYPRVYFLCLQDHHDCGSPSHDSLSPFHAHDPSLVHDHVLSPSHVLSLFRRVHVPFHVRELHGDPLG